MRCVFRLRTPKAVFATVTVLGKGNVFAAIAGARKLDCLSLLLYGQLIHSAQEAVVSNMFRCMELQMPDGARFMEIVRGTRQKWWEVRTFHGAFQ